MVFWRLHLPSLSTSTSSSFFQTASPILTASSGFTRASQFRLSAPWLWFKDADVSVLLLNECFLFFWIGLSCSCDWLLSSNLAFHRQSNESSLEYYSLSKDLIRSFLNLILYMIEFTLIGPQVDSQKVMLPLHSDLKPTTRPSSLLISLTQAFSIDKLPLP